MVIFNSYVSLPEGTPIDPLETTENLHRTRPDRSSCDVSRLHQDRRARCPLPGPKDFVKFDDFLAVDALISWPVIVVFASQECHTCHTCLFLGGCLRNRFLMLVSNSCVLILSYHEAFFLAGLHGYGPSTFCTSRGPQAVQVQRNKWSCQKMGGHRSTEVPIKWHYMESCAMDPIFRMGQSRSQTLSWCKLSSCSLHPLAVASLRTGVVLQHLHRQQLPICWPMITSWKYWRIFAFHLMFCHFWPFLMISDPTSTYSCLYIYIHKYTYYMITATEPSAKLYGEQSSSWGGCLTCHPHYDFNFFGFSKHGKIRRKILLFHSRLSLQHVPSSVIISETTHFSWSQGLRPLQWPFLLGRGHFFFRFRFGLRALIHPPTSQRDTDGEPKMLGENQVILGLEIPSGNLT